MAATRTDVPSADAPEEEEPDRPFNPWRVLGVTVMLGIALFWIWAFTQSLRQADTPASSRNPDYLDDRAWVDEAEDLCAAVMAGIDERSQGSARQSPPERAADIEVSTSELRAMVAELADPLPGSAADREVVELWLADWDTHLDDRDTYTRSILDDPDARFVTTEKFGDQLESVIENFADVNGMPECGPAGDVG